MIDFSKVKKKVAGKEITLGAVLESKGSTEKTKTGAWRSMRPEIIPEKCTKCGICWSYCPEGAIKKEGDKFVIDLEYCKGCLICVEECPMKAIKAVKEEK